MTSLAIPVAIGAGGFVGAVLRHYVSASVGRAAGEDYSFLGTLTVNLLGCFLMGVLAAMVARSQLSPLMQRCLVTGVLGSLTTFSTFAVDSLNLLQSGRIGAAVLNVVLNVVFGLLLVWCGMLTGGSSVVPNS